MNSSSRNINTFFVTLSLTFDLVSIGIQYIHNNIISTYIVQNRKSSFFVGDKNERIIIKKNTHTNTIPDDLCTRTSISLDIDTI